MNVRKSPKKKLKLKLKYRYFHLGNVLACLGGNKSLLVVPGTPTVRSAVAPLDKGHTFPAILRVNEVFEEVIIRSSRTAIEFPTVLFPLPPEPVLFDPTRPSGGHDATVDAGITHRHGGSIPRRNGKALSIHTSKSLAHCAPTLLV